MHVKAIAHASRSLTPAEMIHGQVEKEALELIFAVTRFHKMLYGRHFTLQTDHRKFSARKKYTSLYSQSSAMMWLIAYPKFIVEIGFDTSPVRLRRLPHLVISAVMTSAGTGNDVMSNPKQ